MSALVSPTWLKHHLADVLVIDASWHLPGASARDAYDDYVKQHIQGAVFWDIDAHSDPHSPYPHMLPSPHDFAQSCACMGIHPHQRVVVYDTHGIFSSARVWWMLRAYGHQAVWVLDGGLPAWQAAGYDVTGTSPAPRLPRTPSTHYPVPQTVSLLANTQQVLTQLEAGGSVLDARGAARFTGLQAEPRAGLRSGHMPHARNLPYTSVLREDGRLHDHHMLQNILTQAGLAHDSIVTCGSGITACILALAAYELGYQHIRVYDGSWAQWAADTSLPVITKENI